MVANRHLAPFVVLLATLAPAPNAQAAEPKPQPIIGGQLSEPCGWPSSALASFGQGLFGINCGATLIHPEIIAVYGECITSSISLGDIDFGDNASDGPKQVVEPFAAPIEEACELHPDGWLGFCRLAEPVDLPLNPIVFGCEEGIVEPGREVVMAGFGPDESLEFTYDKHWAATEIESEDFHSVVLPADGPIGCSPFDLGTPLYVEYPDGSWHVIGIAVETADCEGTTTYRRLARYVPWVEGVMGVELTPCHDADGTWNPTEACGEMSMAGFGGVGSWADWCEGIPTVPLSETCGPAFGESSEPVVVIDGPADQASFASGEPVTVEIAVNHAVSGVQIAVDGALQAAVDNAWPYAFAELGFPDGTYSIVAVAEGEDGVTRESAPIMIVVGSDEPGDTGETEAGSETATEGGEIGDGPGAADDAGQSCACDTSPGGTAPLAFATFVLLAIARRTVRV